MSTTVTFDSEHIREKECVLKVIHEKSDEPFNKLRFELDCNRGAPSFNQGHADGVILISRNTAVYNTCDHIYGPCSIVFKFAENSVDVTQIGLDSDCGFGFGVYADGVYTLVDDDVPELECETRERNPCK